MAKTKIFDLLNDLDDYIDDNDLSGNSIALYTVLVIIANKKHWPDVFQVSNSHLHRKLGITEKTLIISRDKLIEAGLIYFKSGMTKKEKCYYSFSETTLQNDEKITVVENVTTVEEHEKITVVSQNTTVKKAEKNTDNIIHKDITYNNTDNTQYINEAKASLSNQLFEEEKKEEPPPKKSVSRAPKKKDKPATEFWQPLVDVYFNFYKSKYVIEPSFPPHHAKSLKKIVENLKAHAVKFEKIEWTEETATQMLFLFFNSAYSDKWMKDHFLLPTLEGHYNSIITNAKSKSTSSIQSSFSAIDQLPD